MRQKIFSKPVLQAMILMVSTIFLTLSGLYLLNRYDNKYISKTESMQGRTVIPNSGWSFLVDDWEMYPDLLLSPEDFSSGRPSTCYRTWAGEYPNLSPFHPDRNPYGTATYRLLLQGDGVFSLYLQEPLCAVKVFVDGQEIGSSGEVSPEYYSPLVRDSVYSFPIRGRAELILQISNFSHYYGGLWYPPAIGDTAGINHLISFRMIVYSLLFFTALSLSLFCLVLWQRQRENDDIHAIHFYFGMLSLSFALRICYPFLRLWGIPSVRILYGLEDLTALLGLYFAIKITTLSFLSKKSRRLSRIICVSALGMCVVTVLFPLVILPEFPGLVSWYGLLVSWYKVLAAVFLIAASLYGCLQGRIHSPIALAAATANGVCLLWGVLSIGRFEPAVGGWPEEYGAFCMVIAFAILMIQENKKMAEENRKLNRHLQEAVTEQTMHLRQLLSERGQLIAELEHDMKSPLTSLSNMAQIIRLNDIMLEEGTREKMLQIEKQCHLLSERLRSIQELTAETGISSRMEPLALNRFLSDFHRDNRPVVELTGPDFLYESRALPCEVMANPEKLSRALENLIYNAAYFTPPEGVITLSLRTDKDSAYITVSDNGCGIPETDLDKIFRRFYTTRSGEGGQGLGLTITQAIVWEHGGDIRVDSEIGKGTTFTIRLPRIHPR